MPHKDKRGASLPHIGGEMRHHNCLRDLVAPLLAMIPTLFLD